MPIRIASTGSMHGPELNTSLELLGKERVAARVKAALETIKQYKLRKKITKD